MKILVINAGSSSLKYQLIDMDNESVIAKGLVERIGIDGSQVQPDPPATEKTRSTIIEKVDQDARPHCGHEAGAGRP